MIIISGPSTVGKNPLIYKACELYNLEYIIPYTSRIKRYEEIDTKDYYFINKEEFQRKIQFNEINEWDYCLENYYGYELNFPYKNNQITHGLSRMALRIKNKYPNNVTTVFLMPDNKDRVFNNLKNIYSGKSLFLRETLVEEELCHSVMFDLVLKCSFPVFDLLKEQELKQLFVDRGISYKENAKI